MAQAKLKLLYRQLFPAAERLLSPRQEFACFVQATPPEIFAGDPDPIVCTPYGTPPVLESLDAIYQGRTQPPTRRTGPYTSLGPIVGVHDVEPAVGECILDVAEGEDDIEPATPAKTAKKTQVPRESLQPTLVIKTFEYVSTTQTVQAF